MRLEDDKGDGDGDRGTPNSEVFVKSRINRIKSAPNTNYRQNNTNEIEYQFILRALNLYALPKENNTTRTLFSIEIEIKLARTVFR